MTTIVFFLLALFVIYRVAYWKERHMGARDPRRTP